MKELKQTLWKAASGVPVIPKLIEDRDKILQCPEWFLRAENGMTARASNADLGLARIWVERLNDEPDHSRGKVDRGSDNKLSTYATESP